MTFLVFQQQKLLEIQEKSKTAKCFCGAELYIVWCPLELDKSQCVILLYSTQERCYDCFLFSIAECVQEVFKKVNLLEKFLEWEISIKSVRSRKWPVE